MVDFQAKRDALMMRFHWNRRVATLAVRIMEGVEDFEDIFRSSNMLGHLLLSIREEKQIRKALRL